MPESVVKEMGGGHEEAFPLAPLPLSLSSPMSKADGATALFVCVFICRGSCKRRLMRHTQLDIHMQRGALPYILPPAGRLRAANRLLPSFSNCLYSFA